MFLLHSLGGPLWVNPASIAIVQAAPVHASLGGDERLKSWVWFAGFDGPHQFVETVDEVLAMMAGVDDPPSHWKASDECGWVKGDTKTRVIDECECGRHLGALA